jgi:hypothetical protein
MDDGGGWLWLLVALGIVALGAGMIYGSIQWRSARRDRREREHREQTTRENYRRGG